MVSPALTPDFSLELQYGRTVAGIDEAGRGPWAGPVVAAAVILNPQTAPSGITDSKKLSAIKREVLYDLIMATAHVGVGVIDVEEIDRTNILAATKRAMQTACINLTLTPDAILVDGNQLPDDLPSPAHAIVKGDQCSLSIAAASIIAKVTRDRIMKKLHQTYPFYGWSDNAGYGTKQHREALAIHGITEHHRQSFSPIKSLKESIKSIS